VQHVSDSGGGHVSFLARESCAGVVVAEVTGWLVMGVLLGPGVVEGVGLGVLPLALGVLWPPGVLLGPGVDERVGLGVLPLALEVLALGVLALGVLWPDAVHAVEPVETRYHVITRSYNREAR
jgi:hypothetical protein